MRWIKHITAAHDDEKLTRLRAECGLEGYGFYWLLCEVIAASVGKSDQSATITHPVTFWRSKLGVNRQKLLRMLQLCSNFALTSHELCGEMLKVSIPNLLKYRDEWTTRSGVTPESLPSKDTDTDIEVDTDKTKAKEPAAEPPERAKGSDPNELAQPTGKVTVYPAAVVELARKLRSRHPKPRRDTELEVKKKLNPIFTKTPKASREALASKIDREHARACQSEQWTKEGGEYAKGLKNWIAANAERWNSSALEVVPAAERPMTLIEKCEWFEGLSQAEKQEVHPTLSMTERAKLQERAFERQRFKGVAS